MYNRLVTEKKCGGAFLFVACVYRNGQLKIIVFFYKGLRSSHCSCLRRVCSEKNTHSHRHKAIYHLHIHFLTERNVNQKNVLEGGSHFRSFCNFS